MYAHICTAGGYLGLLNEGAGYSPLRWCAGQMHVHVTRGEGAREREREISTLLRLFTGYKYRSRTDTQIARGVVS